MGITDQNPKITPHELNQCSGSSARLHEAAGVSMRSRLYSVGGCSTTRELTGGLGHGSHCGRSSITGSRTTISSCSQGGEYPGWIPISEARSHWMRYGFKPSDAFHATLTPAPWTMLRFDAELKATSRRSISFPASGTSRRAEATRPTRPAASCRPRISSQSRRKPTASTSIHRGDAS